MKKLVLTFTLILSLVILTQSCKKAPDTTVKEQIISSTLKKNQPFQYNFGLIGIEDNLTISQQSNYFKTSMLERDNSDKIIYNYQPRLDYLGTDEVEIIQSISNGAAVVGTVKTKFKFTIIE